MSRYLGATVGLPLFVSIMLLALLTSLLLWRGAHLTQHQGSRPSPGAFVGDTLLDFPWAGWLGLVTIVFLCANQLLVRGIAVGTWDADAWFFPYYVLVADHARAGRFVQWDPWTNGGMPALGDPQVGAFSPINLFLGLVTGGTSWGFRAYWLLMWWVGGFGMLKLAQHLRAPLWGACAIALGFLFCGAYTGNAEHTSWIVGFSFLPITIWRLDLALRERRLRPAAEAGALWGLSALAGYPGVIIITGCFAGLWSLGRTLLSEPGNGPSPESRRPTVGFAAAALVLFLLVGVLVLLPAYFGFFFERAGTSARAGALTRKLALGDSFEPGAIATFASPYLAALKVAQRYLISGAASSELWPSTDPSMVSVYAGAITPALAVFGLFRQPRNRWRWWVAGLGVLSLACAMGETLPLRGWLYDWFFPMRFFRHPAIFRLYYLFAVFVLAAMATRDLAADLREPTSRGRTEFLLASILVAICAVLAVIPLVDHTWNLGMPHKAVLLGRIHFLSVWVGVCLVAALGWRLPVRWGEWCLPVLLLALSVSDGLLTSVLSIPTVLRTGAATSRWQDLDQRHRASLDLTSNGWWRKESSCDPAPLTVRCWRNDQLITKIPALKSYSTEENSFHLAMIRQPVLRRMATGAERIWFSTAVVQAPATAESFTAFQKRAEMLGAPPIVIHSADDLLRSRGLGPSTEVGAQGVNGIDRLPAAERIRAEVIRYLPNELIFDVLAPSEGWLLVTDRWARDWHAEVNGDETKLYGGDFIFRALRVPPGQNRIRLGYRPSGFRELVVVSWGTLIVIALSGAMSGMHRPRVT